MVGKLMVNGLAVIGAVAVTRYIYKKGYNAGVASEQTIRQRMDPRDMPNRNS